MRTLTLKNTSGASLISIMIGMAIVISVSYFAVVRFQKMHSDQKKVMQDIVKKDFVLRLKNLLADPGVCSRTFGGACSVGGGTIYEKAICASNGGTWTSKSLNPTTGASVTLLDTNSTTTNILIGSDISTCSDGTLKTHAACDAASKVWYNNIMGDATRGVVVLRDLRILNYNAANGTATVRMLFNRLKRGTNVFINDGDGGKEDLTVNVILDGSYVSTCSVSSETTQFCSSISGTLAGTCSDATYTTRATCIAAGKTWTPSTTQCKLPTMNLTGTCSNTAYTTETTCKAAGATWSGVTLSLAPRCSDTTYTTQAACTAAGKTWSTGGSIDSLNGVSFGNTTQQQASLQMNCPLQFIHNHTPSCSAGMYPTQTACTSAGGTWTASNPLLAHTDAATAKYPRGIDSRGLVICGP